MKKIGGVLIVTLLLSGIFMPVYSTATFPDVISSDEFYEEVMYLVDEDIINGYPDGTFRPQESVTRAHAALMIGRALGYNSARQDTKFSDVDEDQEASGYIAQLSNQGIVNGYPDGSFKPNHVVTRLQMALLLQRAFISSEVNGTEYFQDVEPGTYYYEAIADLSSLGIARGFPDGTFRPHEDLNRQQFAMFLARTINPSTFVIDKEQDANLMIKSIVMSAEKGKVGVTPFKVGTTPANEVTAEWGEPQKKTSAGQSEYWNYDDRFATVGIENSVVKDLRSSDPDLSAVHYQNLLARLGPADEVTHYQDSSTDQLILNYNVSTNYKLKWVFPKPTAETPDPSLHHTSVVIGASAQSKEEAMLDKMTLNEKIGQMVIAGLSGTSLQAQDKQLITDYHVGGFIFYADNLVTQAQTNQFVSQVKGANEVNKLPLFISVDQEGGRVARLPGAETIPTAKAIGNRNDANYAYSIGELLGEQLTSMDFNMNYAPVLDINSNPDNPVIGDRSYSDTADIVSRMGIQVMKGIQAENVIPVVKHFPGHGDTSVDSHLTLPTVTKSLAQLEALELIPFEKAIDNDADAVMVAHIYLPNIDSVYPSSLSGRVIDDLLRDQLGFDGVVMTDDMTMGAIINNYGIGEAAVQTVQAGSDLVLVAHEDENAIEAIQAIRTAVTNGQISEQRINQSVLRILQLKNEYIW